VFESILVANRGEIARRIIRTVKDMGLRAIAVYSEADADLPFVREADEAYLLGPARLDHFGDVEVALRRRAGRPPRVRLPGREPRLRPRGHRRGPHLDRPVARGDRAHGRQDQRA
jgi:hypothetical protein